MFNNSEFCLHILILLVTLNSFKTKTRNVFVMSQEIPKRVDQHSSLPEYLNNIFGDCIVKSEFNLTTYSEECIKTKTNDHLEDVFDLFTSKIPVEWRKSLQSVKWTDLKKENGDMKLIDRLEERMKSFNNSSVRENDDKRRLLDLKLSKGVLRGSKYHKLLHPFLAGITLKGVAILPIALAMMTLLAIQTIFISKASIIATTILVMMTLFKKQSQNPHSHRVVLDYTPEKGQQKHSKSPLHGINKIISATDQFSKLETNLKPEFHVLNNNLQSTNTHGHDHNPVMNAGSHISWLENNLKHDNGKMRNEYEYYKPNSDRRQSSPNEHISDPKRIPSNHYLQKRKLLIDSGHSEMDGDKIILSTSGVKEYIHPVGSYFQYNQNGRLGGRRSVRSLNLNMAKYHVKLKEIEK